MAELGLSLPRHLEVSSNCFWRRINSPLGGFLTSGVCCCPAWVWGSLGFFPISLSISANPDSLVPVNRSREAPLERSSFQKPPSRRISSGSFPCTELTLEHCVVVRSTFFTVPVPHDSRNILRFFKEELSIRTSVMRRR